MILGAPESKNKTSLLSPSDHSTEFASVALILMLKDDSSVTIREVESAVVHAIFAAV